MTRRDDLVRLRDAVRAGFYHREEPRPPKFNALYESLERIFDCEDSAKFAPVINALRVGRDECATCIDALIAQEDAQDMGMGE